MKNNKLSDEQEKIKRIEKDLRKYKHHFNFRYDSDIDKKLKFLLENYPDKYHTESMVVRCAIVRLYKHELEAIKK